MAKLFDVDEGTLRNYAKLFGGLAVLLLATVFLVQSSNLSTTDTLATVLCSDGLCFEATTTSSGATLHLEALDGLIASGTPATLTWWATGVSDLATSFACFGNGVDCTNTNIQQTDWGAGSDVILQLFSVNNVSYLLAGGNDTGGNTSRLYKWTPSCNAGLGGFGDGTTCAGSYIQRFDADMVQTYNTFTIGSDFYLLIGRNSSSQGGHLYKWMSTGTNCPAGGGWGNGTACPTENIGNNSTYIQNFPINTIRDAELFTVGSTSYLSVARNSNDGVQTLQWLPAGTPGAYASGCFGNPADTVSPCGDQIDTIPNSNIGYEIESFQDGGYTYLFVSGLSAKKLTVWRWMPTCNGGLGGFGNGTTCNNTVQQFSTSQHGDVTALEIFVDNGSTYAIANEIPASPGYPGVFKWMPPPANSGKGCFGDGLSTCGNTVSTIANNAGSTENLSLITVDSVLYLGLDDAKADGSGRSHAYVWMPGSQCFGNGSTCSTPWDEIYTGNTIDRISLLASGDGVIAALNDRSADDFRIFRGVPRPCFGGVSGGCGVAVQNIPGTETMRLRPFMLGSDFFVMRVNNSGDSNSTLYQWTSSGSGCPTGGGWGNGSACATEGTDQPYQTIRTDKGRDFTSIAVGGTTYGVLTGNNDNHDDGANIFKWMAADTTLGSGGLTGTYFTNKELDNVPILIRTEAVYFDWGTGSPDASVPVDGFSVRWTGSVTASTTGSYTFRTETDDGVRLWLNGTRVIDDWEDQGVDGNEKTMTLTAGVPVTIMMEYYDTGGSAVARLLWKKSGQAFHQIPSNALAPDQISSNSCFGNGYACGVPMQSEKGSSMLAVAATTTGSSSYLLLGTNNGSNSAWLYTWMPAGTPASNITGCFGNGSVCGTALQSFNSNTIYQAEFFNIGATLYLMMSRAQSDANGVRVYEYMPTCNGGQGGFGDGTTCAGDGSLGAKQTINIPDVYGIAVDRAADGTTYAAIQDSNDNTRILKWKTSGCTGAVGGSGFGNNTSTCGATWQTISNSDAKLFYSAAFISSYPDLFLAVGAAKSDGSQDKVNVYKLQGTTCFGDGGNPTYICGSPIQTILFGSPVYGLTGFVKNAVTYLLSSSYFGKTSLMKWNPTAIYSQSSCTVLANGTDTVATGNSGGPLATDVLAANTTFTLSCEGVSGNAEITVAVYDTITATVSVPVSSATENPSTSGTFQVDLSAAPASPLDVSYTLTGTAQNGTDYRSIAGTLTIPTGQLSVATTVMPINDSIYEGNETVTLTITSGTGYTLGTPVSGTITITDDENGGSLPAGTFEACDSAGGTCELGVTPSRVRKGTNATVTWNVTGLVSGAPPNPGNSCTITTTPALSPPFSQSWDGVGDSWINTTGVTATINSSTIFTLRCTSPDGTASKEVTASVGLIPTFQEI